MGSNCCRSEDVHEITLIKNIKNKESKEIIRNLYTKEDYSIEESGSPSCKQIT